ncbi:cytochrome b-c1 complex subunit 6, mitochondrial-like [Limulus polyphemus]|uniref:Cytochrome b-c1 complex subunit 6 n=1 Tax=Limulus polyphemus TaxID=6850 RepID=A0ABM1BB45_LIMPO|nr:cytochrome b-c1 complex subunit 6, mitochondrial-like [Limulus polyphemus]
MSLEKVKVHAESVEEEEEEEELVDPGETLKAECAQEAKCVALQARMDECTNRVNNTEGTDETCVEELFDFLHCVDHCVSKSLFKYLK